MHDPHSLVRFPGPIRTRLCIDIIAGYPIKHCKTESLTHFFISEMAKTHNEGHGIISHPVSSCGYCHFCILERCNRQVGKLCSVDKGFVMEGEVYSGPSFLERSYENRSPCLSFGAFVLLRFDNFFTTQWTDRVIFGLGLACQGQRP